MTWIYEFRPGNKTIYVVFDEESEFSGPRTPKLRLDQVLEENVPYKKYVFFSLLVFSQSVHRVNYAHMLTVVAFLVDNIFVFWT